MKKRCFGQVMAGKRVWCRGSSGCVAECLLPASARHAPDDALASYSNRIPNYTRRCSNRGAYTAEHVGARSWHAQMFSAPPPCLSSRGSILPPSVAASAPLDYEIEGTCTAVRPSCKAGRPPPQLLGSDRCVTLERNTYANIARAKGGPPLDSARASGGRVLSASELPNRLVVSRFTLLLSL